MKVELIDLTYVISILIRYISAQLTLISLF